MRVLGGEGLDYYLGIEVLYLGLERGIIGGHDAF